ncbi:HypC/HybG/HupF family hydrogenase formation chaperone [Marinobacterium sp. AK62]|uniref:HypC/HybG/HupF family hydrogenase formation chaperone n=1 Tax=Marinobacterium alkalitolerans TaxID=1542925 RepID=A0ABS3ZDU9_9GAMM|nr:HypC/HybG/HupF family hydrogenase formation chaperone [Marinobacterium alkalitolerans]MBP0049879.1 HypC/HybG/HupF family hydrogenase formation chaperone [Marinobacterium alkalitolerans]
MCLGIPGEIVALETDDLAWVEISGVRRQVSLACLLDEQTRAEDLLGQWVLVHVGFAMSLIDRDEAQRTLALLQEMQQMEQESENAAG